MKFIDNYAKVEKVYGNKLSGIASSPALDRDGERIVPGAWIQGLFRYRQNPVVIAAHVHRSDSGSPTIVGKVLKIQVQDGRLEFTMEFAPTENGREWAKLYAGGYARAFSVGFIPLDGEVDKDGIYTITRAELLEISCVAVPANPEALVVSRSKGYSPDRLALADELERLGKTLGLHDPAFNEVLTELRTRSCNAEFLKEIEGVVEEGRKLIQTRENIRSLAALAEAVETLVSRSSGGSRSTGASLN